MQTIAWARINTTLMTTRRTHLGIANTYDFENHLVTHGSVTIVYDGDGNRVSETVGGVTTKYLVDTVNPTGYAQVVDELDLPPAFVHVRIRQVSVTPCPV